VTCGSSTPREYSTEGSLVWIASRSEHSPRTSSLRGASSGWLKQSLAFECPRTYAISGAFRRLFTGTAISPDLKQAKSRATVSTELLQWIATRSPDFTPCLKSQDASASVVSSSLRYDTIVSPQTRAGLSGFFTAEACSISPKVMTNSLVKSGAGFKVV